MGQTATSYKHNNVRKNVVYGGAAIMTFITLLSSVSSFQIFKPGFADFPVVVQSALAIFAVCVVEGTFTWLVYGFTRAFSSALERFISLCGIGFLICVMLMNIATHFMMVKNVPLSPFQYTWLSWGAILVFGAILLIVLAITLADPVVRAMRLEIRYHGRQEEAIINAKSNALESDRVLEAMNDRAIYEAEVLAEQILGPSRQLSAPKVAPPRQVVTWQEERAVGEKRGN